MSSTQFLASPLIGGIAALMVSFVLHLANSARRGSFSASRFSRLMGFAAMASALSAAALTISASGLWGPDQDPPGGRGPFGPYGPHGPVSALLLLAGFGVAHTVAAALAASSAKAPGRQRIAILGVAIAMALQASVLPVVALGYLDDPYDRAFCGLYVIVIIIIIRWWRWPGPRPFPGPGPDPNPWLKDGFGGRLFEGFNQSRFG